MESLAASLKRKRAEEAASNTYSPSSKATSKYHELNLAQKLLVINDSDKTLSYRKLADKYKISRGQVGNILKARAEYENADLENLNPKAKRV